MSRYIFICLDCVVFQNEPYIQFFFPGITVCKQSVKQFKLTTKVLHNHLFNWVVLHYFSLLVNVQLSAISNFPGWMEVYNTQYLIF